MEENEINAFLNNLAIKRGMAAFTQTQALSAIIFLYKFLYKHVLKKDVGSLDGLIRAKKNLPVVFTRE